MRMPLLSCSHGAVTLVRGRNVIYPRCWNRCTEFPAARHPDQNLTLSDLRGKPVILALHPADWSPVCGDQMTLYNEILPEFRKARRGTIGHFGRRGVVPMPPSPVTVTCISRCSPISNPRATSRGNTAPIAQSRASASARCLNRQGTIAWSYLSPIAVNPGADGILDALEKLSAQASAHGHLESTDHAK
jgi:hypothetical protein